MFQTLAASPITYVFVALVGLVMGSFLNCLAWRWVHGESVLHGRSHCTSCGHVLGPLDLIPVLSWVLSRGRCRYCGAKVSARYPITELLCAAAYTSIVWRYGLTPEALELIAFASVLLVLSLTDLECYIIPNETIVACVLIRVTYLGWLFVSGHPNAQAIAVDSLVGGLAVGTALLVLVLIMDRVLGRDSMGGGDLKLFAVAGLYFGWQRCIVLVIVSCVLGIVLGLLGPRPEDPQANASEQADDHGSQPFPFGPAIAMACWFTMIFGDAVLGWYLGLFR